MIEKSTYFYSEEELPDLYFVGLIVQLVKSCQCVHPFTSGCQNVYCFSESHYEV